MITSSVEPAPAPSGPSVGGFGDSAGKRWLRVAPDLVILSGFSVSVVLADSPSV